MNNRVAKAAADKNVVSTTAAPAPQNNGTGEPATVTAAVLYASRDDARPFSVEIEGKVFIPARDQAEERRSARLEQVGRQLDALVGEEGAALLGEFEQLWSGRIIDVVDYRLRQVGWALIANNLHDLWRLIYSQLGVSDERYQLNACMEFLHGDNVDPERGSGY